MERKCQNCGATLASDASKCHSCGAVATASFNINQNNVYSVAGVALALLLAVLCVVTNLVDSSTFINRLYTTALAWNIPLATIALIVIGFTISIREKQPRSMSLLSVILLVVAFLFSNVNKNMVQDHLSNADNYVDVVSEGIKDNAGNIIDWKNSIEKAVVAAQRNMYDHNRHSDYDDEYYYYNRQHPYITKGSDAIRIA